ncbi:MAG: V-type ATP synthase subunit A, partial [Steroidobacteraceae bacterium]
VYEDTTGLEPGVVVEGRGRALSVMLGPGLLGGIFDGLLRPLTGTDDYEVKPGMAPRPPGRFRFTPTLEPGAQLRRGQPIGTVAVPRLQWILPPPETSGRLEWLIPGEGEYSEDESLAVVTAEDGTRRELTMRHAWPVRTARPVAGRLPASAPMITGQRILDTLFPVARGGRATLPGGFGTGKTVLQEALAKWCDADVIVYVGCGERGNEMAEVLDEFPKLEDPRTGRPLAERTVIIANTSNMPVAAREASIYTAISVAEYFRDQGLHVALMADSTSRWAEALREVSGRLGELPGEAGYPAYLSSRLAEFYERAARVTALSGQEGSVTIIGAVSPPAGDFSEPVTLHTKRYVRCFWALDRGRAQARFYPAVHPLQSYSADADALASWWKVNGNPDWLAQRQRVLSLLENQAHLERMARIVGRDALPAQQQLKLLCADLVNDGFLRQSSFSKVDRYCSPARQVAMLTILLHFMDRAEAAVQGGIHPTRLAEMKILRQLQRLGEEFGEGDLRKLALLPRELDYEFDALQPVKSHVR